MLKIFIVITLITSSAFANDVNDISGTFEPVTSSKQIQKQEKNQADVYSANSFEPAGDVTRLPANKSEQKESFSVNDLTGTFQ